MASKQPLPSVTGSFRPLLPPREMPGTLQGFHSPHTVGEESDAQAESGGGGTQSLCSCGWRCGTPLHLLPPMFKQKSPPSCLIMWFDAPLLLPY